jgi:hypothetical protein
MRAVHAATADSHAAWPLAQTMPHHPIHSILYTGVRPRRDRRFSRRMASCADNAAPSYTLDLIHWGQTPPRPHRREKRFHVTVIHRMSPFIFFVSKKCLQTFYHISAHACVSLALVLVSVDCNGKRKSVLRLVLSFKEKVGFPLLPSPKRGLRLLLRSRSLQFLTQDVAHLGLRARNLNRPHLGFETCCGTAPAVWRVSGTLAPALYAMRRWHVCGRVTKCAAESRQRFEGKVAKQRRSARKRPLPRDRTGLDSLAVRRLSSRTFRNTHSTSSAADLGSSPNVT